MKTFDHEPIPGLPAVPPHGEQILWRGSPHWRTLARTAFHTRAVAIYFALLVTVALASGSTAGALATALAGAGGVGVLALIAWFSSRSTVYTITNRRVVLRVGMALPKCINLPLGLVGSADLRARGGGVGDIALGLVGPHPLNYLILWPHVRPWQLTRPQPMLRALPDAEAVAATLARACAAIAPIEWGARADQPAASPLPASASVAQAAA